MKKIFYSLTVIVFLSPLLWRGAGGEVFAQNPDIKRTWHWYFGNGAGIDFSSGTAVADTTGALHTYEGCGVMSDTSGNLLFYTDGDTVWNKLHQPMPNGWGLNGCGNFGSSEQAVLIIPQPRNDSLFYIFTTDCWENSGAGGFSYSIVNINVNNNLGDVIIKNQTLFTPSSEVVTSIKHGNYNAVWIITHECNTSNFYAYLIDSNGISLTPIISNVGFILNDFTGFLASSPNGKLISLCNVGLSLPINQLFNFNDTTGEITLYVNLYNHFYGPYSSCFSSDNSKLYFTLSSSSDIYQYCLSSGNDSSSISATWCLINDVNDISMYGGIQRGSDDKLYVAKLDDEYLATIDQPNEQGLNAQLNSNGIYLDSRESRLGLCYFSVTYFDSQNAIDTCLPLTVTEPNVHYSHFLIYQESNKLIIKNSSDRSPAFNFELFDVLGKRIIYKNNITQDLEINTGNFSKSFYVCKITCQGKTLIKKLILTI